MADFISTTGGKIVNVESIAFLTSRTPKAPEGGALPAQLIIGFSAATTTAGGSMMPLSLVVSGEEADDFLDQMGERGVGVKKLRARLS
jgi:hypothetical protein